MFKFSFLLGFITAAASIIFALNLSGCEKAESVELRPGRQEQLDWNRSLVCPFCRKSSPGSEYRSSTPMRRNCPRCHREVPEVVLIKQLMR